MPQFVDRDKLIAALKPYFHQLGVNPDWRALEALMDDRLVTTVSMLAPFAPQEKQALLEAADTKARAELLIGLIEMAVRANVGPADAGELRRRMADIDPKLLEILVCPLTKTTLRYDRDKQELISVEAGLAYPIRDGIPIMLVDEARRLDDAEQARLKGKPAP